MGRADPGACLPDQPDAETGACGVLLTAAGASALVVTGSNPEIDYWSTLVPALRAEGVTLPILSIDGDGTSGDGDLASLIERATDPVTPEGDEHALAAYYHTGGTTGTPKLVRHSRLNEAHVGAPAPCSTSSCPTTWW